MVRIALEPRADTVMGCSECGHNCAYVHEWHWRQMRDLPMLGRAVWLKVRLRRVRCSECRPRTERLSWLGRHARITHRLAEFAAHWWDRRPIGRPCAQSVGHACKTGAMRCPCPNQRDW